MSDQTDRILQKIISGIYEHNLLMTGCVYGQQPSGKNNYRTTGGRIYKDKEVVSYCNMFMQMAMILKAKFRKNYAAAKFPIEEDVCLCATVINSSLRRDVDTILLCDLLQKSDIIKNDRLIRVKFIDGSGIDKNKPRVNFKLYRLGDGNGDR